MFNRKNDELYQFHIKEGAAYFNAGKYLEATLAFTQAINIDAQNLAYFYRAQTHERTQNYAAAAKDFEDAERLGCNDINYLTRGLMYIQHLKRTTKALKDAIILFKKDMKSECAEIIEQCLPQIKLGDLDEIEKKDLFDIITTLEERGLLEIAISYLEPCLVKDDHNPLSARFWKRDSIMHGAPSTEKGTLKNIGDYVQEKKLKLAENIMQLAIQTGVEQFQAGDNEMAITTFSLVIEENPKCALAFYHRAEVHHHLNQHEAAIQDFCQAETLGLSIKTYKRSLSYAYLNKISEALEDAMYVAKNGTGENGSAIAALCFSQITLDALKKIPRRELFNFIQSLPVEDQIHYLGIILIRGPLAVLGERFWNPQTFKLSSHIEDELLKEMLDYLKSVDSEITLSIEELKKMDLLIKMPNRVQQLRYHICWQDNVQSKEELNTYYSRLSEENYESKNILQYAEDFMYLKILAAEDFAARALKELVKNSGELVLNILSARGKNIDFPIPLAGNTISFYRNIDQESSTWFEKTWNTYAEQEDKDRKVTNHNFTPDDSPPEKLRYQICYNKNYNLSCEPELIVLSTIYSIYYQAEDIDRYLEDFLYLDISVAQPFVRLALQKKFKNSNSILFSPSYFPNAKWIQFQGRNILSGGCQILTQLNRENLEIYRQIFDECAQKEQRDRKVTNHDYKTDDPIEQLRFTISFKKNNLEDYAKERDQLANCYDPSGNSEPHFTYHPDCNEKYIEDFLYRDIHEAKDFVRLAIQDRLKTCTNFYTWDCPYTNHDKWIEFQAPSILSLSSDCKILVSTGENLQSFRQLWAEYGEEEQRKRNVTDHHYKTNDPVEQLRFDLCLKKNNLENYEDLQEKLSQYYLLSPEEGGFTYSASDFARYKEDFILLDIDVAKTFLELAIREKLSISDSPSKAMAHHSRCKDYIVFGFFSSARVTNIKQNVENGTIYHGLWKQALEDEERVRNVTNRRFQSNDPIEQLRLTLCIKKNDGKNYTEEQTKLGVCYAVPVDLGGMEYSADKAEQYLEDFIYLGVVEAEDFILRALEDRKIHPDINAITRYKSIIFPGGFLSEGCTIHQVPYDQNNHQALLKIFYEYYTRTGSFDKKTARLYHYIGDPLDPEQIVYDLNHAYKYVNDWLDGITTAESFVLRVIYEDFSQITTIFENLHNPHHYEKLLDLICQTQADLNDIKLTWLLKLKKDILQNKHRGAAILEEAYNMGVLPQLIEDICKHPTLSSKCNISDLYAIDNIEVLSQVAINFSQQDQRDQVARMLFENSDDKRDNSIAALRALKAHYDPELQAEQDSQNLKTEGHVIRNDYIFIDYYLFSLLEDVDQLLDLAWKKNPLVFLELFCIEMGYMRNAKKDLFLKRKDFYTKLMNHTDMQRFYGYDRCKKTIDSVYSHYNCSADNTPSTNRYPSISFTEIYNQLRGQEPDFPEEEETSQNYFDL